MNVSQLVERIQGIVQDPAIDDDDVLLRLNEGLEIVAGGGNRPHGLPPIAPLPDLFTSGTVTAAVDADSVSMPTDYQRGLMSVVDGSGYPLNNTGSIVKFRQHYPTLSTGSTCYYCLMGSTLYYAPAKAQSLTVEYYRMPDTLEDDDDIPDGLPAQFHREILVNYVCREFFNEIEDGIEGQKVNFIRYDRGYMDGLTNLERFIGPEDGEAEHVQESIGDYVNYY